MSSTVQLLGMETSNGPNTMASSKSSLGDAILNGMLGGPGSGKGTQCQLLSHTFNIVHISIGNVLRGEMDRLGSPYGDIIRKNMMSGKVGPKEITIPILKSHIMTSIAQGTRVFILDGFPRNTEQCDYFEQLICPISFLIVLDCPESVMVDRLAHFDRGRSDDNLDSIRRCIDTFKQATSEVIDDFRGRDKSYVVNSNEAVYDVQLQIEAIIEHLVTERTDITE